MFYSYFIIQRKLHVLILLLVVLSMYSCNSKKKNWTSKVNNVGDFINSFPVMPDLGSDIFIYDSINLINPGTIRIIDDFLVVTNTNSSSKHHLSIFNLKTKKYVGSFLKKGRGPGEYIRCRIYNYEKDSLMVLNIYKKEILLFSKEKLMNVSDKPDRIIKLSNLQEGGRVENIHHFKDKIIAAGAFSEGRFGVFFENGNRSKEFGIYPEYNFNTPLDIHQLGNLFGSNSSFCSKKDKLASINSYLLTLYNSSNINNQFSEYFSIQWSYPAIVDKGYKNGKPFVGRSMNESYRGAGKIVSIGNYLIFPFSGLNYLDIAKKGLPDTYRYLMVMDWEGNPIACFGLDKFIKRSLEKDASERFLYAVHTDLESGFEQIIKYDIGEILDKIKNYKEQK